MGRPFALPRPTSGKARVAGRRALAGVARRRPVARAAGEREEVLAPCASVLGEGGLGGVGAEVRRASAPTRRGGDLRCRAGRALSTTARIGDADDVPGAADVGRALPSAVASAPVGAEATAERLLFMGEK